ncbi:hypothetical protein LUZ61_003679 [Rhynchospora tenuis]|uniref:DUF7876 domain-containing protein n=1 Tax=Rhynchospora tenuis TaxID=198213 RepID=A0AAD5ZLQ6_9POAL|nr:hypothetical protein LUZ61_003679 [Rhynchospora tenuis]
MLTSSMSYISIKPYSYNNQVFSNKFPRPCCIPKMHNISSCKSDFARPWSHGMWRSLSDSISTRNHLLHRFHINALSDEDFKSSRNIAKSIFRRYRNVVDRGGTENLKEFISAGVNAYALGCTEEGLRKELIDMKESGTEIEGLQIHGGGTTVKFKVLYEEVRECMLWLSIVFITILCTPQPTVVRWSSTPPVSDEILQQWKGFCAIIANAYYMRGMAWLPVKTLQLEQMAVMGSAEEPSVVASRMRLVFSTLEVVSPQWPRV